MVVVSKILLGLGLCWMFITQNVQAATIECQGAFLKSVVVEGNRDDGHFFQNHLVLSLESECGEKKYAHVALEQQVFGGF